MTRNQDRTGLETTPSPEHDDTIAQVAAATQGTGPAQFNWSVPTEFVDLPSKGQYYPQNHLLNGRESLEIRYMTAKEEDILTSRALLKEGVALDRMLSNILVDKEINIDEILLGDKNALLVAARRTGYGPDYETQVICPVCATNNEYSFDISEPPTTDVEACLVEWSAKMTGPQTFSLRLPMTSAEVECRFLTSADERNMIKENERKAKKKIEVGITTTALRSFITSVNGDNSSFTIESFIQALPAKDARILRNAYAEIVPNINLKQHFECGNCNYEADMEVPLGSDFFWPER
jgi:hypothetical protein